MVTGMKPDSMTRKDFVKLTFTLIGVTTVAGACSSSNTNNDAGTGAAGSKAGSGGSTAGSGGSTAGSGGSTAGSGGSTAGSGGSSGGACTDPLPEHQDPDTLGHVHTLTIPASTLSSTTDQTFNTGLAGTPAHMHMVTLTAANLATIKGGATVDVMSAIANGHLHSFTVGCTAV
jgi:hypothetical protein